MMNCSVNSTLHRPNSMCIPNNEIVEVLLVKHFAIRLNHFQAGVFHSRPRDQRTSLDVVLFAGGAWINGRLATQFQHYIWHTNYMGLHLFSFGCTGSHYHKVYSFIVSVLWLWFHLGQKKTKYIIITIDQILHRTTLRS